MEKYTKLNIVSTGLFSLSAIISAFLSSVSNKPASDYNPWVLFEMLYFSPLIFLIISLILSIISVKIKKNIASILLIVVVVISFIPICYMQIFIILCRITGYHG
jgi:ABC-type multidrug transport system permease subunit